MSPSRQTMIFTGRRAQDSNRKARGWLWESRTPYWRASDILNTTRVQYRIRFNFRPTGRHRPVSRDMGPSESPIVTNAMVPAQMAHTVEAHEQPNVTHTSVPTPGIQHLDIDALPHRGRYHLDAHTQWFRHVGFIIALRIQHVMCHQTLRKPWFLHI